MGLCDMVGLKFGLCVIAKFRKFCGLVIVDGYVVGVVTVVLTLRRMCSVLLLFLCCILLFVRLKEFCLLMMKKIPKNPANSMRATLACLFTCVCIAHVL